jgi:hypothetical protein
MDDKTRQALIKALSSASNTAQAVTLNLEGQSVAVVLPIENYQQLQAARDEKLKRMKQELDGILTLVRRSYAHHQTLEELETRLAALRQEIEQEQGDAAS